ncbi:hypothetical protein GCM10009745_08400 [Kribbella yunnanensis]|uniref:Uncharacterized protein n=1 Tax=Kribbella yunnanensis TaxID=190194 RepID=A0ABN2GC59_9ACTN
MPEKVRVSPALLSVIHRPDQAALVELDEPPELDVVELLLLDESEDFAAGLESEEEVDDDSDLAGSELLPDERLSVR